MTFALPAFAVDHGDPVVRQFGHVARRLFDQRFDLRSDLTNRFGEVLLPAFPALLERPIPRQRKHETEDDYEKRRAAAEDFKTRRAERMQDLCSVLGVLLGCCDWVTMETRDPDPRRGYLSVVRLAELAGLPLDEPTAERPDQKGPGDRIERTLRMLRMAKIVAYTKHNREELADGRHVSTPSLRKLGVGFFKMVGGALLDIFERRRAKMRDRAARKKEREEAAGRGRDPRIRPLIGELARGTARKRRTTPAAPPAPSPATPGTVPIEVLEALALERPDLTAYGDLVAEARRRGGYDTS